MTHQSHPKKFDCLAVDLIEADRFKYSLVNEGVELLSAEASFDGKALVILPLNLKGQINLRTDLVSPIKLESLDIGPHLQIDHPLVKAQVEKIKNGQELAVVIDFSTISIHKGEQSYAFVARDDLGDVYRKSIGCRIGDKLRFKGFSATLQDA